MEQHGVLVPGEVDIALHPVRAVGYRLQVSGARVFGKCRAGAPVGKNQWPFRHGLLECHEDTLADAARRRGARLGTCR